MDPTIQSSCAETVSTADDLLTAGEVSDWIGLSVHWLKERRSEGYGPPFIRVPSATAGAMCGIGCVRGRSHGYRNMQAGPPHDRMTRRDRSVDRRLAPLRFPRPLPLPARRPPPGAAGRWRAPLPSAACPPGRLRSQHRGNFEYAGTKRQ